MVKVEEALALDKDKLFWKNILLHVNYMEKDLLMLTLKQKNEGRTKITLAELIRNKQKKRKLDTKK